MEKSNKFAVVGLGGRSVFMRVPHFHADGETLKAEHSYEEPGGKGYNQAIALAKLGADVSFISAVGNDGYGKVCRADLESRNVRYIEIMKETELSAFAFILVDSNGDNQVTVYEGASSLLGREDIEANAVELEDADVLVLQLEVPNEANFAALEKAKNAIKILNPAPAARFDEKYFSLCDWITPNLSEAYSIFGGSALDELAERITKKGINAVVTLGAVGALLVCDGKTELIPAPQFRNIVNTTGAGDNFNAAFALKIASGDTPSECVRYAVKHASYYVAGKIGR